MLAAMKLLGAGKKPLHRFRLGLEFIVSGHREMDVEVHAKIARLLAEKLGLSPAVAAALEAEYEHWDGRGWPGKLSREAIPIASRISQMAEYIEVAHRMQGVDAAVKFCRRLRGNQFDPALVDLLGARASAILDGLERARTWAEVIDAEPTLGRSLADGEIDSALLAIANFVDLKSPYFLGHAENVAELAAAAGSRLRLPDSELRMLRRAGLVHGFGRLGVSNAIWDKRGPLGAGELERVRMHPYFTERMLQQSPGLAPIGVLAAQHCERIDGSGYPRKIAGTAISLAARILGAASMYQSMCEPRPHRSARSASDAADELRREVRAGRLDGTAVDAVLGAAGHRIARRRENLAGLTAREVDVLRFVAQGMSTKEVAQHLGIAPKTASNHIERIYGKIGARNRAEASVFAVQNGLFVVGVSLAQSSKNDVA
jgi:HD-GYP domain-containing protein (c-di-GMP phosphodiesterase class II)